MNVVQDWRTTKPQQYNLALGSAGLLVLGHARRDTLTVPEGWVEAKCLRHGDSVFRLCRDRHVLDAERMRLFQAPAEPPVPAAPPAPAEPPAPPPEGSGGESSIPTSD